MVTWTAATESILARVEHLCPPTFETANEIVSRRRGARHGSQPASAFRGPFVSSGQR
jgi:hypothetical protein